MTFKLRDKVNSYLNGENTDQVGTVVGFKEDGTVLVSVDDQLHYLCRYTPEGKSIDNDKFSITKVEEST